MHIGVGSHFSISSETYQHQRIYRDYINAYIEEVLEENPNFLVQLQMPLYEFEDLLLDFTAQLHNKSVDVKSLKDHQLGRIVDDSFDFNEVIKKIIIPAENEYYSWLISNNLISLSQCMILLSQVAHSDGLEKYGLSYKYFFVDEFQDTDDVQIDTLLMLQRLFGEQCKLFIVGDIKQSIYRFRGASVSAFDTIQKEEKTWKQFSMTRNYRTDVRLLDEYDKHFTKMGIDGLLPYDKTDKLTGPILKEYDDSEIYKQIETDRDHFYEDLFDEINVQKEKLKSLSLDGLSKAEKTIAILVRSNFQIKRILKEASDRNVYMEVSAGGDLFRKQSSIDLLILTQALTHSEDISYLMNLIESNYVSLKLPLMRLHGNSRKQKLNEIMRVLNEYYEHILHKSWNTIVEDFQTRPVLVVLRDLYEASKPWSNFSNNDEEKIDYQNNYHYLLEIITNTFSRDYQTLHMINDFLEVNITTFQEHDSRTAESQNSDIQVICTTIHKSKGLEYGTVILPYTNDSIAVLKKDGLTVNMYGDKVGYRYIAKNINASNEYFDEDDEISETKCEEIRILYVAMTRAIRNFVWLKNKKLEPNTWGAYLEEIEL